MTEGSLFCIACGEIKTAFMFSQVILTQKYGIVNVGLNDAQNQFIVIIWLRSDRTWIGELR